MSEIVIRHAEPKDYEAISQIHAQPEVYHNTLQVPHPSSKCGKRDLPISRKSNNWWPALTISSWGHLSIDVAQRPRRSHVADSVSALRRSLEEPRRRQRPDATDDRYVRQLAAR